MARFSNITGVGFGFLVMVVFLQCTAAQTMVHVVGDSMGWTVPVGGAAAYTNWTAGKNFVVGDILTFNFVTNAHDVVRVEKSSFDACTDSNSIGDIITTGPVNITLDAAGDHYYICTFSQHCQLGQKLAISVSAPSTTPRPPSSPTPTTPAVPTADCPTSDPPASGPSSKIPPPGMMTPPPSPVSLSSKIMAGIYVSMTAAIMGFLL